VSGPITFKDLAEQVGEGRAESCPDDCDWFKNDEGEIVFSSEDHVEAALELQRLQEEREEQELQQRLEQHERELYGEGGASP
jgi:hypothetical protein